MIKLLPKRTRSAARLYAWRRLGIRWTLQSGIPIEIKSPADWEVYNEIFVDGEYDLPITRALEHSHPSGVAVLDIGANLGFFSLRVLDLAHRSGRVAPRLDLTLAEGSPRVVDELKRREAFGTLTSNGARLIEGLAGKKEGNATLHESDQHLFNTIVEAGKPGGSSGTRVPFVDLESAFKPVAELDLLKCDIQGAEESFLENNLGLVSKCRASVLELHHMLCDTARCKGLLREAGFSRFTTLRKNSAIEIVHCERDGAGNEG